MTRFVEPTDLEEACALLAEDEWANSLISGGTALVLMMRQGLVEPSTVVSLGRIDGLEGVRRDESRLWIGSRTTHTAIANSPEVQAWLPSLSEACRKVGNVRVRNVGTIGGNLAEADYASDPPTVLVGVDAVCEVTGPKGSRSLPVSELATGFYTTSLATGEIITAISVPLAMDRVDAYERLVSRSSEDRPCAGVAASATYDGDIVDRLTVVVGAATPVPQRRDELTSIASGRRLDEALRREIGETVAASIDPLEDARGSAWYRRRVISVLVKRALERVSR